MLWLGEREIERKRQRNETNLIRENLTLHLLLKPHFSESNNKKETKRLTKKRTFLSHKKRISSSSTDLVIDMVISTKTNDNPDQE